MDDLTFFLEIRMAKCTKIDLDEAKLHTDCLMNGRKYYLIARMGAKIAHSWRTFRIKSD